MRRFIVRRTETKGKWEVFDTLLNVSADRGNKKHCVYVAWMMNGGLAV